MPKVKHQYDARTDCTRVKTLDSGDDVGVMQLYSGWGLITNFTEEGYDRFWIYPDEKAANEAFDAWDGNGNPPAGFSASIDRRESSTS